jgi:type IV pilus assembly protein PilV
MCFSDRHRHAGFKERELLMCALHNRLPSRYRLTMGGISLIEVLVAIVIVSFGLLGLAGLQGRATSAELESYQRGQALILLHDMVNRIENNPGAADSYLTAGTPLGTGSTTDDCSTFVDRADIDACEWSNLLQGSSEKKGTKSLGAMINARGCIEATGAAREYRVAVVWQGMGETAAPTSTDCGADLYDSEASRRAVTSTVLIPDLAGL